MHTLEDLIADVQPEPALRIGFQNAAMLPTDRMRRDDNLHPADQAARDHALRETPEHAAEPDINLNDGENIAVRFVLDAESDVGDAHDLTALAIDDLLIQQI